MIVGVGEVGWPLMQQLAAARVVALVQLSHLTSARFMAGALAAALLAGCMSPSPMSRIDSNRARYESWPLEVQEAVLNGKARKGMTPEQVEMALGKPSEVVTRSATGGDEVWVYRKAGGMGSSLLGNSGVAIGGGTGGVSVGTGIGGGGRRQTPEENEVVFSNGVVIRSDMDK
jgi:hypothetical protein